MRLGWAAGAGVEYAFAPHWSVTAGISLQPVRTRQRPLPLGRAIQFDARFPAAAHRPQPQGRLAGIEELDAEDRPDRSRIRPLGNPRPDHLSAAGLSGVPRALYRHQQPDARAAGPGDLEQQPVSERPALGGRRGLLQSRTAAGIWPERHRGRRRLSRTAKRRNPTSPTRITTPRGCSCARPLASAASRKSLPAGQRQLAGKVDVSRLTLQAGKFAVIDVFDGNAYAKDTRKDFMNWSMWAPGAFDYSADKVGLTYGATAELNQKQWALRGGYFLMRRGVELEQFRHQVFAARQVCGRTGDALFAVLAAGQAAHHRLAQQRLFRQLPRNAEQPGAQSRYCADAHGPHQIWLRPQASNRP